MSRQLLSQLTQATISTFEDLGFVLPTPGVDEKQAAIPLAWGARVGFRGPVAGWLEIRITDRIAEEMASNMLGASLPIDAQVKLDAIGELANVVCGNVVPALGASHDVFDLDAPALRPLTADAPVTSTGVTLDLGLDGGRVELELVVAAEAAA